MTSIWPEIKQKIILPKPDSSDHDVSAHLKINVSPAIIEEKINKKREKKLERVLIFNRLQKEFKPTEFYCESIDCTAIIH